MALSFDVLTRFPASADVLVADTTTGDRSFSHAGAADDKGVAVVLNVEGSSADGVDGITFGGVALTKRQTGTDTTEANRVTVWTLPDDTACPVGTQTVVLQACTSSKKVATVISVKAGTTGTKYHAGNHVDTTTSTNPTMNVVTSVTTMIIGGLAGGAGGPTSYLAGSGYTAFPFGVDYGNLSGTGEYTTSPVAAGTKAFNFTYAGSDDWALAAVALEEFTLSIPVPDAPTSLSATTVNDTTIDLAWTDNADDEDTFRVEVSLDGSTGWTMVYDDLSPDTESVSVIDLDPETEYFFRVYAVNEGGDSTASNTDSATTDPEEAPPASTRTKAIQLYGLIHTGG